MPTRLPAVPPRSARAFRPGDDNVFLSLAAEARAILSPNGAFLQADDGFAELLGVEPAHLSGYCLRDFVCSADLVRLKDAFEELVHEPVVKNLELRLLRAARRCTIAVSARREGDRVYLVAREVEREEPARQLLARPNSLSEVTVDMLRSICRIQNLAVLEDHPHAVFDFLLSEFLRITQSESGFIGEVAHSDSGERYLKMQAMTGGGWGSQDGFPSELTPPRLEFRDLHARIGDVLKSGEHVIANDLGGGDPEEADAVSSFLGLALCDSEGLVGVVGIVNRSKGYDRILVEFLEPLIATCASCLRAYGIRRQRREAEAELRQSERLRHELELAHVARVASAGELAASLAHELNQPLSAILTNARTAQRCQAAGLPESELVEILEDIVSDSQRAGRIIHKLRAFLRDGRVEREPLDLNSVVQGVVELLEGVDPKCGSCLRVELGTELPEVEADRTQIEQVLVNLIRNGLEAMAHLPVEERELVVRTRVSSDRSVECSVVDRGSGVEDVEALFDPFYTTKDDGMGMGLPISRTIVEAHGGHLEVDSAPGVGTTMEFTLSSAKPRGEE